MTNYPLDIPGQLIMYALFDQPPNVLDSGNNFKSRYLVPQCTKETRSSLIRPGVVSINGSPGERLQWNQLA